MIDPFVDVEWLLEQRDKVVLADVRFYLDGRSSRAAYEARHIPGAVFVEMETVLSEPHSDDTHGRHPLPTPERFAAGLGALGIGDEHTVVGYDDDGGAIAARLVWLLRAIGHEAALLDGGINAWPAEDLHSGYPRPRPPARFTAAAWPAGRLAEIDEVAALAELTATGGLTAAGEVTAPGQVLIDARDRDRFGGGPDPVDPRSGHIPGARSVPTREHLDAAARIGSPELLRETFARAGIGPETPVISYCGAGVTACHNLLALERAGLGPGRLYPGSWSEWSRDPTRPVATGEA